MRPCKGPAGNHHSDFSHFWGQHSQYEWTHRTALLHFLFAINGFGCMTRYSGRWCYSSGRRGECQRDKKVRRSTVRFMWEPPAKARETLSRDLSARFSPSTNIQMYSEISMTRCFPCATLPTTFIDRLWITNEHTDRKYSLERLGVCVCLWCSVTCW